MRGDRLEELTLLYPAPNVVDDGYNRAAAMALSPGCRVGAYEIIDLLGAGGMGEVYRARDSKLDRMVALKVLPSSFAQDADRVARFHREAKTLATLNHPHIAQIYGLEGVDGSLALVMEVVEGQDLAQLIARGPMPVNDALRIASQIAEALEAAHEIRVVHRDLKPANIRVRPDGTVKILDFGLARSESAEASSNAGLGVTQTSPLVTNPGVVLGTSAYMSPEQARGETVDTRADIWAFGCVLYELLAGSRAFRGDSAADVLHAVIGVEPAWDTLRCGPDLIRILQRCLAKQRRERYGSISDIRMDLDEIRLAPKAALVAPLRWHAMAYGAVGLLAGGGLVAIFSGMLASSELAVTTDTLTGAIIAAEQGTISVGHSEVAFLPDGTGIVFGVTGGKQRDAIWIRPLDGSDGAAIAGTEGGRGSAISNDGRWLAFTIGGKLVKVPIRGGPPVRLADAPHLHGAAWSPDDREIFFAPNTAISGIWRVGSDGNTAPVQVTNPDRAAGEVGHEWPALSPEGDVLYYVVNAGSRPLEDSHIVGRILPDGPSHVVVRNAIAPRLDREGRLFYVDRNSKLVYVQLAPDKLHTVGEPVGLDLSPLSNSGSALFQLGKHGEILYMPGPDITQRRVALTSRSGTLEELPGTRSFVSINAPPNGNRIAATTVGGGIVIADLSRPVWTEVPLTRRAIPAAILWSVAGNQIAYSPDSGVVAYVSPAGRAGDVVAEDPTATLLPLTWAPDGGRLLYRKVGQGGIWSKAPSDPKSGALVPSLQTAPRNIVHAAVEPRSRLIAYASDHTGRYEIYVRSFDDAEPTIQVTNGPVGMEPHWSADGRTLYYAVANSLQEVTVETNPLRVSQPRDAPWVRNRVFAAGDRLTFAPLPDGRIAYVMEGDSVARHIVVRQNWRALLPSGASASPAKP